MNKGYTLIEIMLVVAIIGTLAAIALPSFRRYIDSSRGSEVYENLRSIADNAVAYYHKEHDFSANGSKKSDGYYPGCQTNDHTAPSKCAAINTCTGLTIGIGERYSSEDVNWESQPWLRLGIAIKGPMLYCYAYSTNNTVTTFEAVATGSLSAVNDSQFKISGDAKGQVTSVIQTK